jgi:hypothetical protein
MSKSQYCYWKRKDAAPDTYFWLGGWCPADEVPEYGYVDKEPLPQDIWQEELSDGGKVFYSPPVFGSRYAYRLRFVLTSTTLEDFNDAPGDRLARGLDVQRVEAPSKGAHHENWWWAKRDSFGHTSETPNRLLKKWKGPMIEQALKGHPDLDEVLGAWNARLEDHKDYLARRKAERPSRKAAKKADGDLVVLPHAVEFNYGPRQVFRFVVEADPFRRRNKHSLFIGSTRYKFSHRDAVPFKDGKPPSDNIKPPMAMALALIAHANAPKGSAHAALAAEGRFAHLFDDALKTYDAYIRDVDNPDPSWNDYQRSVHIYNARVSIIAAREALNDFAKIKTTRDDSIVLQEACAKVAARIKTAQERFSAWLKDFPEEE